MTVSALARWGKSPRQSPGTKLLFSCFSVSLDETSSNASCSTESQSRSVSNPRDSYRASSQVGRRIADEARRMNKGRHKTGLLFLQQLAMNLFEE
jgi:hypothetical protein